MSDQPDDDLVMESEELNSTFTVQESEDLSVTNSAIEDPTSPNHEVEDYTLKRENDSYRSPVSCYDERRESQDDNVDKSAAQRRISDISDVDKSAAQRRRIKRVIYPGRKSSKFVMERTYWNEEHSNDASKPVDYVESREPQENSEEEQIIRLPSETEMTDVAVTHQRSNSESMSNFFSMPGGYRGNDCLNFSLQNRELAYMKHADVFENWKYSDEERAFLRHRVETFTKEQCVIHCILGHMLMFPDEMAGVRHTMPTPDDARQALLGLAVGSHWDVYNLAIIMAFSEKLNVDACINKNFHGAPFYSAAYHHGDEFRSRVEHYFARCLLDD